MKAVRVEVVAEKKEFVVIHCGQYSQAELASIQSVISREEDNSWVAESVLCLLDNQNIVEARPISKPGLSRLKRWNTLLLRHLQIARSAKAGV